MFSDHLIPLLIPALWETLYMVLVSGLISTLLGIPLGMILFTTRKNGILACLPLNLILSVITNIVRSIPFIILLVAILPFTQLVVGTSIGTNAAMVPLTIGTIPFIGKIVENALEEVPHGLTEAALAMGATPLQIMYRFLLPEALPTIINGLTVTLILLISYSAMAGTVGGGGLGDLGIRYGYERFEPLMMLATVIILIIIVQIIQWAGNALSNKCNKKQ